MTRILFVDDDPMALTILTKAAEIIGYQVIQAQSGAEALQIAAVQCPDIIFVDQRLVDMDGLSVIRSLCADAATGSIPVIMLSACSELDIKQAALNAGAAAYLHKPVQLQVLEETVKQYTSSHPKSPDLEIRSAG